MRLFDDQGNVCDMNIEDMECIKRDVVSRKNLFCNGDQWFSDANTLEQLIQLYDSYGFHQIDKNKLININKVDRYEKGQLWVQGTKYSVSRGNIPYIRSYFDQN